MPNSLVKLLAVGDIFLADSPLKLGRGVKTCINKKGREYYITKIKSITCGHDICFGNLESVLSRSNYNKYNISTVEIRGEASFINIIKESGFNVVNIANNHIFQHGLNAYLDTIRLLLKESIKVIGDEYLSSNFEVFECNEIEVGFIGYSMHYEQYRPTEKCPYALREKHKEIVNEIRNIKVSFSGILICSLHWGYEFLDTISIEQREFCHNLVDCGVSLILGHHPHVPQGVEVYNGALIAYSLGNFIFDMDIEETKETFALSVNINKNGIDAYELLPVVIGNDYCPYKMDKKNCEKFIAKMNGIRTTIESGSCLSDKDMKIKEKRAYNRTRKLSYFEFFKNITKMNLYHSVCIIMRTILRRMGILANP
jgi:poly-gamma-glutamate synthesis protein (capsule biosynthesis protein)